MNTQTIYIPTKVEPEELEPLQGILNEGYDPYDTGHHLQVQRWLSVIENFLNK